LPSGKFESPKLEADKLPQFVIPTTPSTAFVKAGSAVHDDDTHERIALFDPKTRARAVFVHPSFLATAPAGLVVESALNTLATAIEALESPRCDPVSEALLRQALRMISVQLKAGEGGDPAARDVLAVAAVLCGRGTDQAGGGLASVLGHAIGHRIHVSNGIVNAIVLTHVMRFNSEVQTLGARRIADSLRELGDIGLEPAHVLDSLFLQMGVPRRLRDIGVKRADLPVIADVAMKDWFICRNARPVEDVGQVMCVLEAAW
jgi:alcohol dehydrogenase class IV